MTTTEFIRSLNLQDKIIKSAKLTLKKITLEGNNQTQSPLPSWERARVRALNNSS
jgi:hypothetical protein